MPSQDESRAVDIMVPSKDPAKEEDPTPKHSKGKWRDTEGDVPDISEEDLQLKSELEMLVERFKESDTSLYLPALESLRTLIRTSTSSMTSVPKPLKFLRPHYDELGRIREGWATSLKAERALLASILSVLAMTYSDTGRRDTLYYRLISQSEENPGTWGHEYVRHLAAELGEEYVALVEHPEEDEVVPEAVAEAEEAEEAAGAVDKTAESQEADKAAAPKPPKRDYTVEQLRALGLELVDFFLQHNAEVDAVDLVLELECIEVLAHKVDDKTFPRVCQYMVNCVPLLVPPDDEAFLRTAAAIYSKNGRIPEALALAIRLHDRKLVRKYFEAPTNPVMKKQLAFIMARANVPLHWVTTLDNLEPEETDEFGPPTEELPSDVVECLGNYNLSTHFRKFGKAVGVEDPRTPDDVYKTYAEGSANQFSARDNLASTFVNAFVNAGFGNEKMIVKAPEGESFIYKNKDRGMMSATASVGMSLLWDHEGGIDHVDKYTYANEELIKAGAYLSIGILYSSIRASTDIAWALLEEHIDNPSTDLKIAAITASGMSHAGSELQYVVDRLAPYVSDDSSAIDVAAMAALSSAYVYVGSGNGDVASSILQTLMEREDSQLDSPWAIFFGLALGLIFLGRQDAADATLETLRVIEHPVARSAEILVEVCAYAGTGNVLKVQSMLHVCAEHAAPPKKKEEGDANGEDAATEANGAAEGEASTPAADAEPEAPKSLKHQAMAVIGIALVAMGEDVGAEMALRQFQHLMTYGDPVIRKAVPLALALISASNPQLTILDTLSKYSHDSDLDVAVNAILAMGIVGAGTNNARLAQMLRGLATYYAKEPDTLFMVRIAQGFVHMGKGTIGVTPFFQDRQILNGNAVAGLLSLLVSFTEARDFVLGKHHWMLYWLAMSMFPQFLIMLDEDGEEKDVTVRVGQAVNTIGLAGTRSGISGITTHSAPVRVGTVDRAEMGTGEFVPYTNVLEGFVFVKKNPGWDKED